jgi:hypothetical protein
MARILATSITVACCTRPMVGHLANGGFNGQIGTHSTSRCGGARVEHGCSACAFCAALRPFAQPELSADRQRSRRLCRSIRGAHAEIETERQTRSIRGQLSISVHYLSRSAASPDLHFTGGVVWISCTVWLKPERQPHGPDVYAQVVSGMGEELDQQPGRTLEPGYHHELRVCQQVHETLWNRYSVGRLDEIGTERIDSKSLLRGPYLSAIADRKLVPFCVIWH